MIWRIEVSEKEGIFDATGEGAKKDISEFGIKGVKAVRFIQVYTIEDDLEQDEAERIARESMDFLTKTLFIGGKLVPIGQENWYVKGKVRSIYDQQPIEAAGMTTAYLKAFEKTGEEQYLKKARASFDWFLGKNSGNQVLYDESTGGCFDGLTRKGVNANQGAESTISYLFARLLISNNSN